MKKEQKKEQEKRRITIIGTGLIGGSLGLALKGAKLKNAEIVGYDQGWGMANQARRLGAIDRAENNLRRAVAGARMVIIATPTLAVREVMAQIADDLAEGAVVTDTASTKVEVLRWAEELLPPHVSFVGGHPMAGKETPGIEHAEATLFRGKTYCICPAVRAGDEAMQSVVSLAQLAGAEPLFLDPEEHDQYAAAVSHLPLLISMALFTLLRSSPSWSDMAPMTSTGFRDLTRLASGDPRMSHDICVTNREAVVHWLERMAGELYRLRSLLQDANDEALLEMFAGAQMDRDVFVSKPPERRRETPLPNVRQHLLDVLVGRWMAERVRRVDRLPELMTEGSAEEPEKGKGRRLTLGERIAEDVRRDLEKRSGEQKE